MKSETEYQTRQHGFKGHAAGISPRALKGIGEMAAKAPRINYVELPSASFAASAKFYADAFGWSLTQFGPTYAATMTGDVDLGLQGDMPEATKAPLPVIDVGDLDEALATITKSGGVIVRPIFAFPGGRRFHFRDPSGNELAVVKADDA